MMLEDHYTVSFPDGDDNLRSLCIEDSLGVALFHLKLSPLYPQKPPSVIRASDSQAIAVPRWRPWFTLHRLVTALLLGREPWLVPGVHCGSALEQQADLPAIALHADEGRATLCEAFRGQVPEDPSILLRVTDTVLRKLQDCSLDTYEEKFTQAHQAVLQHSMPRVGVSVATAWIQDGTLYCCHCGHIEVGVLQLASFSEAALPHHDSSDSVERARVLEAGATLEKQSATMAYVDGECEETRGLGYAAAGPWMLHTPQLTRIKLSERDIAVVLASKGIFTSIPWPEMCSIIAPRVSAQDAASEMLRICQARNNHYGAGLAVMYLE